MALVLNKKTRALYLSLSQELRRDIDDQIKSLSIQVSNAIDKLDLEISSYVESNSALTSTQIKNNLKTLQSEGGGLFADTTKSLTGAITDKVFTISEDIFFGNLKTEADYQERNDLLTWIAMLVNTCPSCLPLHGQSMRLTEWRSSGGVPNQRDTLCTIHGKCHCILVPSDTMPSERDLREPIRVQASRIRKANKKRGKDYASSTRQGFLGQINNPKSTISDLRKVKKVT